MLKPPILPLLRHTRRPVHSTIARLSVRSSNGFYSSRGKQQKESQSQKHNKGQPRKPVLVASALSATATTVGGGLLLALLGYGSKEGENDSQYATRQQMELVSVADVELFYMIPNIHRRSRKSGKHLGTML
jgi:D-lactate dehydrogenase (cytochrome)